ncbi:MAG: GDSL-type esterase/lipase family protein [Actinomycetota bacterium]
MSPEPFIRGVAFKGTPKVPYPRADPNDAARLPLDTWGCAQIPAGVRIEFEGDATEIAVSYETRTEATGPRGEQAGVSFALWCEGNKISEERAVLGSGILKVRPQRGRSIVYLPEGMRPVINDVEAVDGSIEPASKQARWVAYGDSILEGWNASAPANAWGAIVAREHGLDLINMGYAGAARGEIVSAQQIASIDADVITISHGTNCWTRIPHSAEMMFENTKAFLRIVRASHPSTPMLIVTPIIRPDAEQAPNVLGATLVDLRDAMKEAAKGFDVIDGLPIVDRQMLADDVHPNDDGHRALADALGPPIAKLVKQIGA